MSRNGSLYAMVLVRMVIWVLLIVAAIILVYGLWLRNEQGRMVFFPTSSFDVEPAQVGLVAEAVRVEAADGERIRGWYFPALNPDTTTPARVVLFCHGNGGNISHRLETAQMVLGLGAAILMFDYRGYGKSDGAPSEENVYVDAESAYRWLVDEKGFAPEQITVFGRSLGGAVAVDLASKEICGGLIVESSFTSAPDMGKVMMPWFPVSWILKFEFDSESKIAGVGCPVLITHSPTDEMIPYRQGRRLFERALEPKSFVDISGGHNAREYLDAPEYVGAVIRIVSRADGN